MFTQIPGFSDYLIDDSGVVYSLRRGGNFVKPDTSGRYLRVVLYNDQGERRKESVHRLVLLAWEGPSPLQVNHLDGNKHNNHVTNLEYCTHVQNMKHAAENGLLPKGENSPVSVISNADTKAVMSLKGTGLTQQKVSALFGISRQLVSEIWRGNIRKGIA